jgi:hypothetical protein
MLKDTKKTNDLPTGRITLNDLAGDIQQRTQPKPTRSPQKPQKERKSFPFDTLPLKAQELVKGAKTALGIPSDILAASMLFTSASAAGNTVELEIKKGFTQKPVFYMVLVGLPNSNKSGALKFALAPIQKQDTENFQLYKAQNDAWEAEQAKPKKEREEIDKPIFSRAVISDTTPEALVRALQESPRGLTLYRDELAGWWKDFNRYHQGSEQEFFLSAWSLAPLCTDRISSDPTRLPNVFLSVVGTIQPGVIEEMAKGTRSVNGFLDRFLFCWPEGLEKPRWTDDEISLYLVKDYEEAINRLLGLTFDPEGKAHRLTLSKEAKKQLFKFFNDDNKRLCDEAENEHLAGIYGKFDFHIIRLVISLHLLHWAFSGQEELSLQVEPQTVTQAIEVGEYFRTQTLKVYHAIHQASPVDKLPANYRKLYEALPETFKTGEGEAIAKKQEIPKRTFRDFLARQKGTLFEKLKYGEYSKIY